MPTIQNRPRILLITRNLPPLIGGMERLMLHLASGMAEYAELTVIGPKGCAKYLPRQVEVKVTSERLAPFLLLSSWLAIRTCNTNNFEIVIGGSGLVAPTLRLLTRIFRCKTAIYLHGLDLVVENVLYQRMFVPSLRNIDLTIVNSRSTRQIAIDKGVLEERIAVVNPGTNIPEPPSAELVRQFRSKLQIPFEKIIVFVGRITQRKGLSRFIDECLPYILENSPEAGLLIVGKNPAQSLNQLGVEKEVLSLVENSSYKDRIAFLGQLSDTDLEVCYAISVVQILPLVRIQGDVEGFGMVAIEAAALGTPTVAFALGGVVDSISTDNGRLVPEGRYDLFGEAVVDILDYGSDYRSCRKHASSFSWDLVNARFREALNHTIKR